MSGRFDKFISKLRVGQSSKQVNPQTSPSPNVSGTALPARDQAGPSYQDATRRGPTTNDGQQPQSDPVVQEIPKVHLESFVLGDEKTTDKDIVRARLQLHAATEALESVLQQVTEPSQNKLPLLRAELQREAPARSSDPFDVVVEISQADQALKEQSLSSRTGRFVLGLYPLFKLGLGIANTAASNAGFMPVQVASNGITQILDYLAKPQEGNEVVKDGLNTLSRDRRFLRDLQRLPNSTVEDALVMAAIELQTTLSDFIRISILWLKKQYFVKFANGIVEKHEVQDAWKSVDGARNSLQTVIIDELYLISKRHQIQTEAAGLLQKICSDELHDAQISRKAVLFADRAPKSSKWIFAHNRFLRWSDGGTPALWCYGLPGAGKSTIMSMVVSHLEESAQTRNTGLAYVFCQRERQSQQSASSILGVIIRQLLARKPDLCFQFKAELEEHYLPLEKRKTLLLSLVSFFRDIVIVIDALDEFSFDHDEQLGLIEILVNLGSKSDSQHFRFCIASREAADAWQLIENAGGACLAIIPERRDIELMVKQKLAGLPHARKLMKQRTHGVLLKNFAVAKLMEKSNHVFKLASLQFDRALGAPSLSSVVKCLEDLSPDINDYYIKSVERLYQKKNADLFKRLFTWICFSKKPIHLKELEFALGIEHNRFGTDEIPGMVIYDLQYFISDAEGLLTIFEDRSTVPSPNLNDIARRLRTFGPPKDDSPIDSAAHPAHKLYDRNVSTGPLVSFAHETIREFFHSRADLLDQKGEELVLDTCIAFWTSAPFSGTFPYQQTSDDFSDRMEHVGLCYDRTEPLGSNASAAVPFLWWSYSWPTWIPLKRLREQGSEDDLGKFFDSLPDDPRDLAFDIADILPHCSAPSTPLAHSARHDWADVCQWILDEQQCSSLVDARHILQDAIRAKAYGSAKVIAGHQAVSLASPSQTEEAGVLKTALVNCAFDVVRILVKRPDIDVNLGRPVTALPWHVIDGHTCLEILLQRPEFEVTWDMPIEPGVPLQWSRRSVLGFAAIYETFETFQEVMRRCGDRVNDCDALRCPTLYQAVGGGRVECVRSLLAHPMIDVNASNYWGGVSLSLAVEKGNAEIVDLLLGHPDINVNLNLPDRSPLLEAISRVFAGYAQAGEILSTLLAHVKTDVNSADFRGCTALAFTASAGMASNLYDKKHTSLEGALESVVRLSLVERLTAAGADLTAVDSLGHTPLDYTKALKQLLEETDCSLHTRPKPRPGLRKRHRDLLNNPGIAVPSTTAAEPCTLHDLVDTIIASLEAHGVQIGRPIELHGAWEEIRGSYPRLRGYELVLYVFNQALRATKDSTTTSEENLAATSEAHLEATSEEYR